MPCSPYVVAFHQARNVCALGAAKPFRAAQFDDRAMGAIVRARFPYCNWDTGGFARSVDKVLSIREGLTYAQDLGIARTAGVFDDPALGSSLDGFGKFGLGELRHRLVFGGGAAIFTAGVLQVASNDCPAKCQLDSVISE